MSKGENMREIKFRGKDLNTKQWVYGYYSCGYREYSYRETEEYKHWIESWNGRSYFISEVDPNTVGQFTGLYDKNGKEIYEGDTVRLFYYDGSNQNQLGKEKGVDTIIFEDGCFKFKNETTKPPIGYTNLNICKFLEIVGNIHD